MKVTCSRAAERVERRHVTLTELLERTLQPPGAAVSAPLILTDVDEADDDDDDDVSNVQLLVIR